MNFHELCCIDICKHFTHKKALDGASITFQTGSIHALLGENGAGKSTLAHIISGFITQSSGLITYDGISLDSKKAVKPKIFMVHQNPKLAEEFSVWQNALLSSEKTSLKPFQKKAFIEKLEKISMDWNLKLDLNKKVSGLTDSERFYAALICRLAGNPDFLILDEPTAVLDAGQRSIFFSSLKKAKENLGIIYISHNLEETIKLCDRISVLKKGICKVTLDNSNYMTSEKEILNFMFDETFIKKPVLEEGQKSNNSELKDKKNKEKILAVKNLSTSVKNKKNLNNISFECNKGEITLIKGEKNGGIRLLEKILTGIDSPEYSGEIEIFGRSIKRITPSFLRENKTGIVSSKKYLISSNLNLTIKELLVPFSKNKGFDLVKKDISDASLLVEKEGIDISLDELVSNLSGGMLQRLILAREISLRPELLILSDPLYGLDYKTLQYLENKLLKAASEGTAILILMTDADDGFSKWDSLYEVKEGQIQERNVL